ncbi:unnamed protein product [Adineta ricciae]|uniref:Uncharacterized protein n=1 Tax=Adineta ricciae TaxID=249248 RepID=A0A815U2Y3_ADIRI|nr:unnamed protein product [Adineta ricciae]
MLSDQAVARRERTKEKRVRREQRILQKRTELLGKHQDDDDTNVAVQQAIEQTAVATPASQAQPKASTKTAAKQEKKEQQPAKTQQPAKAQPSAQTQQPVKQQTQPKKK